ncbi:ARM repeat superfamily protein [Striga asiatica]|uniref:ARM repeat superfamily protein n=1 Tax=Striga asiatica TaxID=4170 RepID=A0A5A7PD08_STRAF|nr:ARM repeat superfamily protein [Striga asiatica]
MALRPIDNAMPILCDKPKKQAKAIIPSHKEKQLPVVGVNDENKIPLPQQSSVDASIDYISSQDLKAFQDPDSQIQGLVGGLESKDWLKVCESLNDVRRFSLHHPNLLLPILDKVVLVMVKTIKNPRSALCKTSIMASSDLFKAFGVKLLESSARDAIDHLFLQLLLKASQDKKFVCEEADRALLAMVEAMPPLPLLHMLSAFIKHSNLRVRAKAAISISNCVSKMDLKGMEEFGLVALIQSASNLLNDKLPEAREAARSIVVSLHGALTENEESKQDSWQSFCQSNLPAIHAQSMVKLVSS